MTAGGTPGGSVRSGGRWARSGTALKAAIAIAVAVWALVFYGEQRRSEHDPRFCASSCHHEPLRGAAADFHARGHEGVACQDCHATSLAQGLRLVWATW